MTTDSTTSIHDKHVTQPATRDLFGHPKGLSFIVFTEAWERFSFYGMQGLLVLYMSGYLFQADNAQRVIGFAWLENVMQTLFGALSVQALAAQVFGLYVGLVYFLPVFGGLLGDRFLGRTNAVLLGGALMAIGHFLMAFEPYFLFALLFLILGSGFLKGNLAAQVGELYAKEDQRRDSAYSLYSISIMVGAFVAPLVCGTLGEVYGWHYGFSVAGFGMLVALVIYVVGIKHLPVQGRQTTQDVSTKLSRSEYKTVAAVLGLIAITSLFWVAQTQIWNAYPIWIKEHVDRSLLSYEIPVTWFQSIDMFAVLVLAPLIMWLWRRQSAHGREPKELTKIAIGCAGFAAAFLWLGMSELVNDDQLVPVWWPIGFHFIIAVGFLYASPVTLSLVSRAAPQPVNAMLVGSYYLAIFVGGIVSGWLARFYEPMENANFWFMHAAIALGGTVLIVLLYRILDRYSAATSDAKEGADNVIT